MSPLPFPEGTLISAFSENSASDDRPEIELEGDHLTRRSWYLDAVTDPGSHVWDFRMAKSLLVAHGYNSKFQLTAIDDDTTMLFKNRAQPRNSRELCANRLAKDTSVGPFTEAFV